MSKPPYAALWKSSIWRIQLVSGFHLGKIWATIPRSAAVVEFSLSICKRTCDSGQDRDPQRFAVGAAIRRSSSKKLKMKTSRSCGRSNEPSSGATATRSPSGCRSNERCPVCGPM